MLRFFLPLLLALVTQSASAATILILGDSLSAAYGLQIEDGWVARLQREHPEHQWVNASISGETTSGGLSRLPALLTAHKPDVLIIELGANDGLRGQPLNHTEANLQAIIDQGKDRSAELLLLGVRIPPNYGARYTDAFSEMYSKLATRNSIAVVPFFLEPIATDPAHFQADHLHPNARAQPLIADNVWPTLKTVIDSLPGNPGKRQQP